jgi:hypothetical protein
MKYLYDFHLIPGRETWVRGSTRHAASHGTNSWDEPLTEAILLEEHQLGLRSTSVCTTYSVAPEP